MIIRRFKIQISLCCFACTFAVAASAQKIITTNQGHSATSASASYAKEGYKLVWADEFNVDGKPDSTNWKFERGFVRNEELQWYQQDNAWIENGMLIIEGRKENKPNPRFKAGSSDWRTKSENIQYTSSSINTSGKHSWQYGRFEMRGRIDISEGLWPAWWTLGVKGEWPSNGEIDIMEFYQSQLLANIAMGTKQRFKAKWYTTKKPVSELGGKEWSKQFHTWRMDWNEKEIALYVDGKLLNKVKMAELHNRDSAALNPFKQPHYMLLNLAIGGKNGGDPANTAFANRFEVDYVRVYQ